MTDNDTNPLADAEPNVQIRECYQDRSGNVIARTNKQQYCFSALAGDKIRGGSKADIEGAVAYTGSAVANNYISESSLEGVPEPVIDAAADYARIVSGTDGGWASWDGRPEFSTSYIDITDVEIIAEPGS